MIIETFANIGEHLKESLSSVRVVRQYCGEFEDDAEWHPVFPAVFWEVVSYSPLVRDGEGKVLHSTIEANLYCADKKDTIELIEQIINALEGYYIIDNELGIFNRIEIHETKLFGWQKNIQIYAINVKII